MVDMVRRRWERRLEVVDAMVILKEGRWAKNAN